LSCNPKKHLSKRIINFIYAINKHNVQKN
jgi:hypothetical protein